MSLQCLSTVLSRGALRLYLVAVLSAFSSEDAFALELLSPEKTHVVIAGVLNFEDPDIISFPVEKRKDRELDNVFDSIGVPIDNRRLLLDADATEKGIHEALLKTVKASKPGDTLFFYYAGHGSISTGKLIMVSFDADKKAGRRGFSINNLENVIATHWKGDKVILMGDFCYSGHFADVATRLRRKGIQVISLTSASQTNQSTGSWSFTQTLIDGLRGRAIYDLDKNGVISLGELAENVSQVMRVREAQKSGFFAPEGFLELAVSSVTSDTQASMTGKWKPGDWVCTAKGAARVLKTGAGNVTTERYKYNSYIERKDDVKNIIPFKLQRWPAGANVDVVYNRKVYEANILEVAGDFHKITYPGYSKKWDEWITSDRIVKCRDMDNQPVEVEWHGKWYEARKLCRDGNRTLIRYEGYDRCWNEWVGGNRMRPLP